MDETKQPGITIEKINLLGCTARVIDLDAKLQYRLALTDLSRVENVNSLIVIAKFDLMHGIENPPCSLKCTFMAAYACDEASNMKWAEFSDVMAVAHMIPYVREFVSSVTLRMPIRELIVPPTNVNVLVSEFRARQNVSPPGAKPE
jgi:hypothetical protein